MLSKTFATAIDVLSDFDALVPGGLHCTESVYAIGIDRAHPELCTILLENGSIIQLIGTEEMQAYGIRPDRILRADASIGELLKADGRKEYYCSVPGWTEHRTTSRANLMAFILERFETIFGTDPEPDGMATDITPAAGPELHAALSRKVGRMTRPASRRERFEAQFEKRLAAAFRTSTPAKRVSLPLGRGWSISLRRDEVVPAEPGAGTPAMLCGPFGAQSTLAGALSFGTVDGHDWEPVEIPPHVLEAASWAEDYAYDYVDRVTDWMTGGEAA